MAVNPVYEPRSASMARDYAFARSGSQIDDRPRLAIDNNCVYSLQHEAKEKHRACHLSATCCRINWNAPGQELVRPFQGRSQGTNLGLCDRYLGLQDGY